MASAVPGLFARVALDVPVGDGFDYSVPAEHAERLRPGSWVLVPWGRARRIGIVIELRDQTPVPSERLRELIEVIGDAPAPDPRWLEFVGFAARYYHRAIGEVALPAIPKLLRTPPGPRARGTALARARERGPIPVSSIDPSGPASGPVVATDANGACAERAAAAGPLRPAPTPAQQYALDGLSSARGFATYLLHGVTGSGKTEVYLSWLAGVLAATADSQVLLLVPEIALTPQLIAQVRARFVGEAVAVLHSDLPDGERAAHWLAAADARVRVVVGTRLAVLTPLPRLAAIVVDEEHDASYKQHEGVRYSARDLAIALASQRGVPVVLGSATPSLESWLAARRGRYRLLSLPERIGGGALPQLKVVDPRGRQLRHGLAPETVAAIEATIARGEQVLVFLNRRGYAPVLGCDACGWVSRCDACSAFRVLHRVGAAAKQAPGTAGQPDARPAGRSRYRIVCHHCGADGPVPRACPECGNVDLSPVGRGTQRLEDGLRELFPGARIVRVDRDVARRRNAAREAIDAAHAGDVDILVGTQMLAKGHDFRTLTLVAVVDPDSGLFSSDFRAPERLFALLMQVSGRAGRSGARSEVIVQTHFPSHPIFAALARHDYAGFADVQLAERRDASLPPFVSQALLRADAKTVDAALAFLAQAADEGRAIVGESGVRLYDAVPMPMMRVAGRERAQLLVESASRKALHGFVDAWLARLAELKTPVRWLLEIDPIEI